MFPRDIERKYIEMDKIKTIVELYCDVKEVTTS